VEIVEIDEERKRGLRFMREHFPGFCKLQPEYVEAVRNAQHFDSAIGFIEQGGGAMLTSDHTAAEAEQVIEATREKGGPSADYLFDRWFVPWCKGKSPDTIANMRNGWSNHFRGSEMNTKPAAMIEDIEFHGAILNMEGSSGEPMKRAGMKKWMGVWRTVVIKPLIRKGSRSYDPFEDIVLPKDKSNDVDEPKGYSWEDFQRIRASADGLGTSAPAELQEAYLDIAMGIGGRPNEVLMLKDSDFNLVGNAEYPSGWVDVLRARHGSVKDGQPKRTPLLPLARRGYEMIANSELGFHEDGWLFWNPDTGKPWNKNYDFGTKKLCAKLDVEYLGRYGFRHGYCYALTDGHFGEEWSDAQVAKMLRHRGMESIKHYYRVNKKKLAEKAQRATVPEVLQPTLV
jgi:integrase